MKRNTQKKYRHECRVCASIELTKKETICKSCVEYMEDNPPKKECIVCNRAMRFSLDHYIQSGNYCRQCSLFVNEKIKKEIEDRKELREIFKLSKSYENE